MQGADGGGRGAFEAAARAVAVARGDLFAFAPQPLPPLSRPRRLRWLPHVLVVLCALAAASADADLLSVAAALLALRRPLPAWWLSLAARAAASTVAIRPLFAQYRGPWEVPELVLHAVVLLLLALRVPFRVAGEALAGSVLFTAVLGYQADAVSAGRGTTVDVLLLTAAVLIGAALRGRREANDQLAEQENLTAEERARRTLLEERARIARELHDVVAHHMSVISIQAQAARYLADDPSAELLENLAGIRANAVAALAELRRVLGVLRPDGADGPPTDPQPTLDRLGALAGNARAAGLAVHEHITGDRRPLPPGVELSAYRIVQEALSNAMRYAPGSAVRIEIGYAEHSVRIQVANSAPTAEVSPSPGAGCGLLGMRERAGMLGGELVTGPTGDGGWEVAAVLPLTPREGIPT